MIKKTYSQNIPNSTEALQSLDAQRQSQKMQFSNTMGASMGIGSRDTPTNNGQLFDSQNPAFLQQKSSDEMKQLSKEQQAELKRQMTVLNALSSQMQGTQNDKEQRLEYLNRIYENGNLGFQFFEKKPENEKINVEFEQVNKALNIIRSTKKDKDNKKKEPSSVTRDLPCALLTLQEMKQRMQILNQAFPSDELQLLFPQRKEINARELTELLKPNLIEKDPLTEAIKLFLDSNGEVSKVKLNQVLKYLGHGTLDVKELQILKDILDIDGDGKISGEDLRQVLSTSNSIFQSQKRRMSYQSNESDKKQEGMNTPQS